MSLLREYILPRLLQWVIVIFVGVTVTFIIPRLAPSDPVQRKYDQIVAFQTMDPQAARSLCESLTELYGLEGNMFDQYIGYWGRLIRGDLGPSFTAFPTPVIDLIWSGLPWTLGLLLVAIIISWFLGLFLGTVVGYFPNSWLSQFTDKTMISILPVPYYILALLLLIAFTYYLPLFPLVGGARGQPEFTWEYFKSLIEHAFLPALSIIIGSTASRFIYARALTATVLSSDYVRYAETAALPKRNVIVQYVARNTLLPQITDLGLSFGTVFSGALITEVVFSYPGIGYTLYNAILQADFNLIMGITLFSIVGIATASLLVDLSYPLFDPRIRYR